MAKDLSLTLPDHTLLEARTRRAVEHAEASMFRHALRREITCTGGAAFMRIAVANLEHIRVASVESSGHLIRLIEPQDVTLLRPVRGSLTVTLEHRSTTVMPGQSLLLGPGERTTAVSSDFHGLVALLPMTSVDDTLATLAQGLVRPGLARPIVLDLADPASAQLDWFLLELVRQLSETGSERADRWSQQAAAHALLALVAGAAMTEVPSTPAVAASWQVRRAEELLRARVQEPVSLADLCRELQISARALQLAFRRHRGLSPMQFVRQCRLELAREQLLGGGNGLNVTAIAYECGMGHPGRFAAAYKARYGESPLATLQRGRGSTGADGSPCRRANAA